MELREVIRHRRMVRRYERRAVPPATIDAILDLARRAPTAGFAQGVDFLVLDTPETVAEYWRISNHPQFPASPDEIEHGPTVLVLPIADKRRYLARYSEPDKAAFGLQEEAAWSVPFWDVDAAMASMVALLAAVDAGLGAWFFNIAHGEAELLARFGVPEGIRPIGVMGFGYPAADPGRRGSATRERRALGDQVHRNGW